MSVLLAATTQLAGVLTAGLDDETQHYFCAAIDSLPEQVLDRCRNTTEWRATVHAQARKLADQAKAETEHQALDQATAVSVGQARTRRL